MPMLHAVPCVVSVNVIPQAFADLVTDETVPIDQVEDLLGGLIISVLRIFVSMEMVA